MLLSLFVLLETPVVTSDELVEDDHQLSHCHMNNEVGNGKVWQQNVHVGGLRTSALDSSFLLSCFFVISIQSQVEKIAVLISRLFLFSCAYCSPLLLFC